MKKPRWRLPMNRATGVVLGQDRLVGSVVGAGPLGPINLGKFEVLYDHGKPGRALREAIDEGLVQGRLGLGLGSLQTLSAIVPVRQEDDRSTSKQAEERFPGIEGGLVATSVPLDLPVGPHLQLTAARRLLAQELLDAIEDPKLKKGAVLIPGPPAFSQRALARRKAPKGTNSEIHVLPSEGFGLAILIQGKIPMAWRPFEWPDSEDVESPRLAILSLTNYCVSKLGLPQPQKIVLRTGAERGSEKDLSQACGLPAEIGKLLNGDDEGIAASVGAATLRHRPGQPDLFAEVRPPRGLRENFPLISALVTTVLIAALAFQISGETSVLEGEIKKLEREIIQCGKLRNSTGGLLMSLDQFCYQPPHYKIVALINSEKAIRTQVELAETFLVNRTRWSPVLSELSALLPDTMTMEELRGRRGLSGFGSRGNRSKGDMFHILGQVPFDDFDSAPPEVSVLTEALESSEMIHADFPIVNGANIRFAGSRGRGVRAKINIVCTPRGG